MLVNYGRAVTESDVVRPLDDGLGRLSDQGVAYCKARFECNLDKTVTYRYRHNTDQGAWGYQAWVAGHGFNEIYCQTDVNEQLEAFLSILESKMDLFSPYKTTVRPEKDPPWINPYIKQLIKKRRRVYHREGRSQRWKAMMKKVRKLVKRWSGNYWEHQKRELLKSDASRVFFENVKAYSSKKRPPQFDMKSILPGLEDSEVAEKLADLFNGISCKFKGLDPADIPVTFSSPVQMLSPEQVALRLKQFK